MNSRLRVEAALRHKEADRVPIDLGATGSSGVHVLAYGHLRKALELPPSRPRIFDLMQQIVEVEKDVLEKTGADCVLLYRLAPRYGIPTDHWKEQVAQDGSRCLVPRDFQPEANENGDSEIIQDGVVLARMPKDGYYYDSVYEPLAQAEREADLAAGAPAAMTDFEVSYLEKRAKELYETTEYAIVGAFGGSMVEMSERAFGFEKFMENLLLEPELLTAWFEILSERYLADLEKYLDKVGPYLSALQFSDDLGTQNSLLFSRDVYRKMIWPYHRRVYDFVHKKAPEVKVLLHSCGAIRPVLGDLIEAGVDAINPVQISASDMDPKTLKREFGRDVTFWGGGADMQQTVANGTLEDIRKEVRELMEIFKPGGGFVFTQVHNIQPKIPGEKVAEIFKTAATCRSY